MSKVTLKPGDYVRTEGMTEDQYHAVAKAFMAAGAGKDEYPCRPGLRVYSLFGWSENNTDVGLCHWRSPWKFGSSYRELTLDQILGTEPDADGWIEWHGGECPVDKGALVDVRYRDGVDGMAMPALTFNIVREDWRVCVNWKHENNPGDIIAYRIHQPKQEQGPMTIEQLLTKANKHAAKAAKHEEKAAKHTARQLEYFARAAGMVPDGYELRVKDDGEVDVAEADNDVTWIKPEGPEMKLNWSPDALDMTDPANWRAGDVVERVAPDGHPMIGDPYTLIRAGEKSLTATDSDGLDIFSFAENFKWISRPQGETK